MKEELLKEIEEMLKIEKVRMEQSYLDEWEQGVTFGKVEILEEVIELIKKNNT